MDGEKVAHDGRIHGHTLAQRIFERARREGLDGVGMSVLFAEDVNRHARAMGSEGLNEQYITIWINAVAEGYGRRMDQLGRRRQERTNL
jgi:hypothetical protein